MAERQGLKLEKSRRRDPRALDYGTYQLARIVGGDNWRGRELVSYSTSDGYGLSLDEIEKVLTEDGPTA